MARIIYYVASSIDGYISGPNEDISSFVADGNGVQKYLSDLNDFKTVIMGRKTYEFGFKYGLPPGQPAYPHMEHFIFSDTLVLDNLADNVHIEKVSIERVKEIKAKADTDIYLCGGGEFAGWLLEHELIDQLKVKLNPIILGGGVPIFGKSSSSVRWQLIDSKSFDHGLQIQTYDVIRR